MVIPPGGTWRRTPGIHLGVFLFNVTTDDLEDGALVDDLTMGQATEEAGGLPDVELGGAE